MPPPIAQPRCTSAEYLVRERAADTKSELINGQLLARTGGTRAHNLIVGNIAAEIHAQLRGRLCEAYVTDMRVKVARTELYTYPDLVAVCGDPVFEDEFVDTLLNPSVIIEVLSDSTEKYDPGEKFATIAGSTRWRSTSSWRRTSAAWSTTPAAAIRGS